MFELLVGIAAVVAMAKVADHENRSELLWGGLTVLAVALCIMVIPLPFLRVLIALVAVFVGMIVHKAVTGA